MVTFEGILLIVRSNNLTNLVLIHIEQKAHETHRAQTFSKWEISKL